jgi:H+/gluconate symporter-like permease
LIFWEAIFIGIPVLIAIVAIYAGWWKKLPDKERKEYKKGKLFGKRSKKTDAGGGISFLIFIVFCILVYLDNKWGVAISTWEFNYLVHTWLWAVIWIAIIIGIPVLIGATWWLRHEMKK